MKIAGQKNSGAWFRVNKALKTIRDGPLPDEVYDLGAKISALPSCALAYDAVVALGNTAGVTLPASPSSFGAWVARMMDIGIPHQVWMGRLSFTNYVREGESGNYTYAALHQSQMHNFGKDLRKVCKVWLHARRAIKDLMDIGLVTEGNPGGQPDATENN